jgi:DNA-binding MarR family transcriptional regulator
MAISRSAHGHDETQLGLGTLLRISYQVMMAEAVEPNLAAAGYDDIRSAHLPVIQALSSNPAGLRSTELATHARITKQSMGYLVDHLDSGGYVERVPDPTDQRAKVVCLTQRGWELSRNIRSAVLDVETDWAGRVGTERMKQLRATLRDLVAGFER